MLMMMMWMMWGNGNIKFLGKVSRFCKDDVKQQRHSMQSCLFSKLNFSMFASLFKGNFSFIVVRYLLHIAHGIQCRKLKAS